MLGYNAIEATKASSEEEKSDGDSEKLNSSLSMSARHLPPVYVDIQEEIEYSMLEINKHSKEELFHFLINSISYLTYLL